MILLLNSMPIKICNKNYFAVGSYIGYFEDGQYNFPSEGTISTNGEKGAVNWSGSFYGQLGDIELQVVWSWHHYYLGITGFTGIRITNLNSGVSQYYGHAVHVALGPSHP